MALAFIFKAINDEAIAWQRVANFYSLAVKNFRGCHVGTKL
jgi:hypothetical protein